MRHRQVGERQEHAAAVHELPRGADDGRDRGRRPARQGRSAPCPEPAHREQIRQIRLRAQMVFQEFNLFPHLKVIDNLIEAPIRVKGMKRDEAIAVAERFLDKVGLREKRDEYPSRLSGGQKQRVAIARALTMEPEGAPVRRADLRARPDARRRGAQRHGGARPRGRDDDRRHPRDGVRPRGRGPRLLPRGRRIHRGRPAGPGDRRPAGPADPRLPRPHARRSACPRGRRRPPAGAVVRPPPSRCGRRAPAPARAASGARSPRIIGSCPPSPVPTSSTSRTSRASA